MKSKNGFTLVELLAVIVILAIIAIIATPIILNVIDEAKKGAAKASALGYLDAVEKQIAIDQLNPTKASNWTNKTYNKTDLDAMVQVKGSKPTDVSITISGGKISDYSITIDGYKVTPDSNGNITVTKVGETSNEEDNEPEEEISKDEETTPVNVGLANCDIVEQDDPTKYTLGDEYSCDPGDGVKRTFYVLDNSKQSAGYIELLMHGNIGQSQWASNEAYATAKPNSTCADYVNYGESCNDAGPLTAMSYLKQETTDKGWTVPVNLPTVEQIAYAAGNTSWTNHSTAEDFDIISDWLTSGLNDSDDYGYWTSSIYPNHNSYIWTVEEQEIVNYKARVMYGSEPDESLGVRAVITVATTNVET